MFRVEIDCTQAYARSFVFVLVVVISTRIKRRFKNICSKPISLEALPNNVCDFQDFEHPIATTVPVFEREARVRIRIRVVVLRVSKL